MQKNEVGVSVNLSAQFDMSGNTSLSLEITDPLGVARTPVVPTLNTSVVAVDDDVIDEETGLPMADFPANESVEHITAAGEFNIVGTWLLVVVYTEGATILRTNPILLCVGE